MCSILLPGYNRLHVLVLGLAAVFHSLCITAKKGFSAYGLCIHAWCTHGCMLCISTLPGCACFLCMVLCVPLPGGVFWRFAICCPLCMLAWMHLVPIWAMTHVYLLLVCHSVCCVALPGHVCGLHAAVACSVCYLLQVVSPCTACMCLLPMCYVYGLCTIVCRWVLCSVLGEDWLYTYSVLLIPSLGVLTDYRL